MLARSAGRMLPPENPRSYLALHGVQSLSRQTTVAPTRPMGWPDGMGSGFGTATTHAAREFETNIKVVQEKDGVLPDVPSTLMQSRRRVRGATPTLRARIALGGVQRTLGTPLLLVGSMALAWMMSRGVPAQCPRPLR